MHVNIYTIIDEDIFMSDLQAVRQHLDRGSTILRYTFVALFALAVVQVAGAQPLPYGDELPPELDDAPHSTRGTLHSRC